MKRALQLFGIVVALAAFASASTLTGTVTNGTNGKPVANNEVVLISFMGGMQESAHAKTDAQGRFTLNVDDPSAPHLVRVPFGGATYNKMAPPGSTTADVTVYAVASKVDGLSVSVESAYETDGDSLKGVYFYTVRNSSNPPRTQGGDKSFEFILPAGATIDVASATAPNGQPLNQTPTPTGQKDHYAFSFPVRPGDTVFQIGYHVPYSGKLSVAPKVLYPVAQFAVALPESMKFEPANSALFQSPSHEPGIALHIASAPAGKELAYTLSGTGQFPDTGNAQAANAQSAGSASGQSATGPAGLMGGDSNTSGPGGGIGRPIDAPDPLSRYRVPLIAMLSAVMALGALFLVSRRPASVLDNAAVAVPAPPAEKVRTEKKKSEAAAVSTVPFTFAAASTNTLAALKEELFQLEIDRQQGRLTQAEYDDHKAALDKMIARAVKRQA